MNTDEVHDSNQLDERKRELKRLIAEADSRHHLATELELLRQYLRIDPANSFYRYRYGDSLRSIGASSDALRVLASLDVDAIPESKRYLVELSIAGIHEDRGEYSEANSRYIRAVDFRRDLTIPWIYLASFLAKQGKVEEATKVLEDALTCASGDLDEVYLNLGNYARAMGDYQRALQHYNSALAISADYPEAVLAVADLKDALQMGISAP
jgi:tetratricopeptide (TPR) repeat protein